MDGNMDSFTIGCHLSASGGFADMAETAASIGATTFQFFSRNPRGGAKKEWRVDDIARYDELSVKYGIKTPLAHAPYTLNPAGEKEYVREFAKTTLREDLTALEAVAGAMYNIHPGSHVGQGAEKGVNLVAECLNESIPDGTVPVLLETMSGKGSELGSRFEEIAAIIEKTDGRVRDRLGVCLDTCHVYDGWYDIRTDIEDVLEKFGRVIGLSRLKAVHLNDSKYPFSTHHDRHEVIGGGSLGLKFFGRVINNPFLRSLPFYLETPNDLEGYKNEIALLRGMRDG